MSPRVNEHPTRRSHRRGVPLVLTVVVAVVGIVGALVLLQLVAPLYLGGLARLFDIDERLRSGAGVVGVHAGLTVMFAAPLVVAVTVVVRGGATLRRRVPRPGGRRPQVAQWRWVLLVLAGAYTIMVVVGAVGAPRARTGPAALAERIGDLSPAGAEVLQHAAYPTLAVLLYSVFSLRFVGRLVRGGGRRRGWVYLAGALVVLGVVAAIAGAAYR